MSALADAIALTDELFATDEDPAVFMAKLAALRRHGHDEGVRAAMNIAGSAIGALAAARGETPQAAWAFLSIHLAMRHDEA